MTARLSDPLVVTTRDAGSWWKRAVDSDGHGLYAKADCTDMCPELRSIRELAVYGLTGMLDAVPVPVGSVPQPSELETLRARVAELEALTPAAIQTCRKCGAGYTYGEPCQSCVFKARMAAEVAARGERPVNRLTETFMPVGSLRDEDEFHLRHDYRVGHDLPETGGAL
ncbi:hypothetical protein OG352_05960 [Streptomyces sp. NBC_01485]|uniref:hypothetical protein n=1 Tax=Streptomyces sp. NBC_01485 TaxID=2903884 RepID=UPI002E3095E2|nr:hypothetical protein [Streptomyces sp. NBC_01485]